MENNTRDYQFEVDQLRNLYIVAQDKNHKFEVDTKKWILFEPSKFIYNFFAFNTFYNINWPKSVENEKIFEHKRLDEKEKIYDLIKFIFQTQEEPAFSKVFFNDKLPIITDDVLSQCQNITVDREGPNKNVSAKKKFEFIERLTNWKQNNFIALTDYFEIISFIYLVRNNIFHGSKTFHDMVNLSQRSRLYFYANVLSATNKLLFQSITLSHSVTRNENQNREMRHVK